MSSRPKRKAKGDTAQKAKKAKGETDLGHDLRWTQFGAELKGACPLILLDSTTLDGCEKAAGFDIDFTVIKTSSGRRFATGASDWEFWDDCVPEKLRKLNEDGYRVMFFTNQAGIEKNKVKPAEIMTKIEAIIKELNIPVFAFIATGNNHYRKPSTMMWDHFVDNCNGGFELDLKKCMYIGDAAGRAKLWAPGKPRDFSCSDRMFGANIGDEFYTPEEFFLGEKAAPFKWKSLDPKEFMSTVPKPPTKNKEYHSKKQEVVIMVGWPASGKSTFRKRFLEPHGYLAVNRDTMGTMQKCIKAAKEALKAGQSVVADNTNPSAYSRAEFIDVAQGKGVPCRCFVMSTPRDLANHLNFFRQNQTKGQVRRIPDVGYNVYNKNFEEPQKSEGFSEIIKIDFVPKFDTTKDETLFKKWATGGE